MTRISIYSKDVNVTGNDRWIGSDAQNQNRTKNFTPDNVATYFNENQVIDLGVELRYFYDTLDPLQQRVYGSITFETEIGPQVNFSAISTFILSKYTMGHTDVSQFLDFLIGSNVLLSRANNINMFGYYKIDNIEPYLPDPNFFVVTLTFDAGNGYMKEDEDYFISLIQFEQTIPEVPTKTSDLINDGEDGVHPFITAEDVPTPTLQSVTDEGDTTTTTVYLNGGAISESINEQAVFAPAQLSTVNLNSGSGASLDSTGKLALSPDGLVSTLFAADDITQSITLQAPNKAPGSYTLATTDDIPAPQVNSDWDATSGVAEILNKPTIPAAVTKTSDLTNDGENGVDPFITAADVPASVTSVGLTMPSAFTVTNSPITSSGDISVTGAGVVSQYVRGDGSLANFPTSTGGGASLSFYLNGSVSQGTIGGVAFREMDRTPILGAGTDFTINANGYIQSFITDANVPNLLEIPAGNWNFETYFSASSGGGSPSFYVELYKWNGTTLSLIASNSATPEGITNGTAIDLYVSALAVPQTTLLATDRLAIRIYVTHSGRTIKLHTENSHLCQVITTFSTGLTALNGLTTQVQSFATGTSGTDFDISSATSTHTFNLPTASAANRGALSSTDWTTFNNKLSASISSPVNRDLLAYNSSTDIWENKSFRKQSLGGAQFFTDFISAGSATPNLAVNVAGTGATTTKSTTTAAPNQTVNQIGICQYQTGTTATGFAVHTNDNQGALAFTFGGGSWVYETFIEVDTLSTLTEQFRFITGFATQASVINEVNAIIFTYDSGGTRNGTIASPNWQCVTSDNSTRTLTTTSVAVTTTWTKLRIEINADATEVKFYINDNLVATHTQNIPTFANSRFLIMKQQIVKTIGTTNRSVYCDYLLYENNLTTLR